jgi:hypothetical protein
MAKVGTCRNDGGHHGPLEADGYCSQACREAALHRQVEEIRAGIAARQAWIREELAGLDPLAARWRLRGDPPAEEAAELERGYQHLTVAHGYLERHQDWELLERLLTAVDQACAGHHWHREGRKDRFTLTVGPPDADRVVTRLAELARASPRKRPPAAAGAGLIARLKYPRERW